MRTHLIHRQRLELNYADESKAREEFSNISGKFYENLLPILEEVFDEYAPEDQTIRIESLEIELVQKGPNPNWEDLKSQLRRKLSDQLVKVKIDQTRKIELERSLEQGVSTTRDRPLPLSQLELFIFILENGHLPWWSTSASYPGFDLLLLDLLAKRPSDLQNRFEEGSLEPAQWTRLVNQLKISTAKKLGELLDKKTVSSFQTIYIQFKSLFLEFAASSSYFEIEVKKVLLAALAKNSEAEAKSYFEVIAKSSQVSREERLSNQLPVLLEIVLKANQKKGLKGFSVEQKNAFVDLIKRFPKAKKPNNLFSQKELEVILTEVQEKVVSEAKAQSLPKKSALKRIELTESQLINNAGLVLVAPFLPAFFKALGYVSNKQFVHEEVQRRAPLLLQSFIQPEGEFEETDLILNKLLCGMPLSDSLSRSIILTEKEKAESQHLLDSMVSHWKALKSTSGKSVSQGFFAREGTLRKVDKGYQLHIQRSTIDILLNSLPWTIGIIKLPWMDQTLFTEW